MDGLQTLQKRFRKLYNVFLVLQYNKPNRTSPNYPFGMFKHFLKHLMTAIHNIYMFTVHL